MPDKQTSEILAQILSIITPFLIGIVGYFVRQTMVKISSIEDIDRKTLELSSKVASLDNIKSEWVEIKIQLTKLMVQMEGLNKQKEDQTILSRDLRTAFKQIDRLKDDVFDLKNEMKSNLEEK